MADIKYFRLTQASIDKINLDQSAVPGKYYMGPDKTLYQGNDRGKLIVVKLMNGEIRGEIENNILHNIERYSREEIIELLGMIKDLEKDKANKCFVIAMSVALG